MGAMLLIGYSYSGSGSFGGNKQAAVSRVQGDFSCTAEVHWAIPFLKKAYGDSMHKVLHVGPDSCSIVSKLLKEEETEAWGVEPYDIEEADSNCKSLVHKGIYLNKTLPDLARVSADGLIIFAGFQDNRELKFQKYPNLVGRSLLIHCLLEHRISTMDIFFSCMALPAKLRSSSWWVRYFVQTSLEENEAAIKKFEPAITKSSYNPSCQIFHLKSYN
ncbi:Uncharacterized protein CK203_012672 [Vitis vinifera]|uniref:Uncharacterized protein n=1 Tax=Vitis vinifera TaxID=29760 RepID=A0A438KMG5_VITVI|nr:Uncharacterized protein CK203_012672 [Vitis vinifera]